MERRIFSSTHLKGEIVVIVTVGINLTKNVFAVHGVDATGKTVLLRPCVPAFLRATYQTDRTHESREVWPPWWSDLDAKHLLGRVNRELPTFIVCRHQGFFSLRRYSDAGLMPSF
jgi:hypothetical protein